MFWDITLVSWPIALQLGFVTACRQLFDQKHGSQWMLMTLPNPYGPERNFLKQYSLKRAIQFLCSFHLWIFIVTFDQSSIFMNWSAGHVYSGDSDSLMVLENKISKLCPLCWTNSMSKIFNSPSNHTQEESILKNTRQLYLSPVSPPVSLIQ